MLAEYIKPKNSASFDELESCTRSLIPTAAFGVSQPFKYFLTASLFDRALYIAKDSVTARRAADEIEYLTGKKAVYLPAKDDVLLYNRASDKESLYRRITALYEIDEGAKFVTCTFESLLQLCPKSIPAVRFKEAGEYRLSSLIAELAQMGYVRREFIEKKGEFALRGDVFEIFPVNSETAYRCDFFGDEIEKIRLYDAYQGKSGEDVRSFTAIAARDVFLSGADLKKIKRTLSDSVRKVGAHAKGTAHEIISDVFEALETGEGDGALSFIAPLLPHSENGIFRLIAEDCPIIFDECKQTLENLDGLISEHESRVESYSKSGRAFDFTKRQYYDKDAVLEEIGKRPKLALQSLTSAVPAFRVLKTVRFSVGAISRYALRPEELYGDLINWKKCGYRAIICCGNGERAAKLSGELSDRGISCASIDEPQGVEGIYLSSAFLTNGFILHDDKLAVIGTGDLYIGVREKKVKMRRKDTFSAPNVGDYAVHEHHGIGIVRGADRISTMEGIKDYLTLEYAGGDLLHVPVDQLDRLTKYLGGEQAPKLSRLGGAEFEKLKSRVRDSIREMSINLKSLYRERSGKVGFAFSPDTALSREFDMAFEYEETEDQLQSIAEIKRDMESKKVMDRLLCGDVGFGKTEVAFRAAFKAVMDSKQVAFVAPTTILTEQHYDTAVKRFEGFGVRIALLNRFTAPKKARRIIEELKSGGVDIVIGTHRLFAKDVAFYDLGLLILDEEQCFGVEHKEKLKLLKSNVDTLTMTATPIPRTLHMSLSGIRDISLINTPPSNRIPVQAYVVEESDELIRDAVRREIARGGQVFILYNRVETIYQFAERVKQILPDIRLIVGHGRMAKDALETSILGFYRGEADVLVCTTIIENGIDVPSANTLIVIDADRLGLFTLYQLKGRVGRSDKMAHAYFTYKPDKVLGDTAYKRLSALMEFTELGSGYKIAMRDLEIRGAGNVLGREQHGHMDRVGYELYSKLLREELGESVRGYETELDMRVDAFIPEEYISDGSARLDAYKVISEIDGRQRAAEVRAELTERFGRLPEETENLLKIAVLKSACARAQVIKAALSSKEAYVVLGGLDKLSGGMQDALEKFSSSATLTVSDKPRINFGGGRDKAETLELMTAFVEFSLEING